MVSRGEVGLIVAGVGVGAGILTSSVYSTIVIMGAVTTIITPIWLKLLYRKEQTEGEEKASGGEKSGGAGESGGESGGEKIVF